MKTFQRLLGILLVAAASAALFVACGDTAQDSCLTSEDCGPDERCNLETEQCAFACTPGDGICLEDETCDTKAGDGGGVCVTTGGGNNGPECSVDEDCGADQTCDAGTCVDAGAECTTADDCEGDNVCVEGTCEAVTVQYNVARIADVSDDTDASLCEDVTDPGSDIFGVELVRGSESYWARWVNDDNIITDGNNQASPVGIIDGTPLDLTGDCPESFSGNVVALGCGGSMLVEFVDADNVPQSIEDGDTITVYEWGSQCGSSGSQDEWSVSICESSSDVNAAECAGELVVNSGTGEADVTVDLGN